MLQTSFKKNNLKSPFKGLLLIFLFVNIFANSLQNTLPSVKMTSNIPNENIKVLTFKYKNSFIVVKAKCSQVLKDKYQLKCYSYKLHEPKFNFYYLNNFVNKINYRKRYTFEDDKRISFEYQNYVKCYKGSHIDRGHLDSDANMDFNKTILKTTYLTSNIVPEYPYTNRRTIAHYERIEREYAMKSPEFMITGILTSNIDVSKRLHNNPNCAVIPKTIFKLYITSNNINGKYIFIIQKLVLIKNVNSKKDRKVVEISRNDLIKYILLKNNIQVSIFNNMPIK